MRKGSIGISIEEVQADYPTIFEEFVESIRNSNSLSKRKDIEDSKWFYSWGFFVPKAKTEEDKIAREEQAENAVNLPYEERLAYELTKVRVNVSMKLGHFIRGDRARKALPVADSVKKIVAEGIKVTMLIEQKQLNNQEIIDTIPEVDPNYINPEELQKILDAFDGEGDINIINSDSEPNFNIDDILDKISQGGIEAISDEEKDFLDRESQSDQ